MKPAAHEDYRLLVQWLPLDLARYNSPLGLGLEPIRKLPKSPRLRKFIRERSRAMTGPIETFANQYAGRAYEIEISCPEFTSVCPKTGQPDFGEIRIIYTPAERCIELKALKLYMNAYRDQG